MITKLTTSMIEYYAGDAKRIQHFLKVQGFARLIAARENLGERERTIIEAAAVVHDVGIKIGEKLYGVCTGKQQEQLGPPMAKRMLADAGYPADVTERVCQLVARHHTYTDIDGIDLQILIEADLIVNLCEDGAGQDGILSAYNEIFKTDSGKLMCRMVFGLK